MSCEERRNPVITEPGDTLGSKCGRVQQVVGHVKMRCLDTNLLCDSREKYFLGEHLVVTYLVGFPYCLLGVQGKKKPLNHIGDGNKRHRVISRPDDDTFASAYTISHSPEGRA